MESAEQVFVGLPELYVAKGAHIAHFFRGEEERLSFLVPYVQAGMQGGDQCVLVAEPQGSSAVKNRLRREGVDVDAALASGQLIESDGGSEVGEMSDQFDTVIARARSAGRQVIRIAGDMTWALSKMPTAEKLLE